MLTFDVNLQQVHPRVVQAGHDGIVGFEHIWFCFSECTCGLAHARLVVMMPPATVWKRSAIISAIKSMNVATRGLRSEQVENWSTQSR